MKLFYATLSAVLLTSVVGLAQTADHPDAPAQHHGPPPAEALAACQGMAASAPCTFTHDGHTIDGTCFTPASDKPLACRPSGPPPAPKP